MSTHAAPSHDANRIIMRVPCRETPVTPPGGQDPGLHGLELDAGGHRDFLHHRQWGGHRINRVGQPGCACAHHHVHTPRIHGMLAGCRP